MTKSLAIVSVEGDGKETAGQHPVIGKSEIWQANNDINGEKVRGPFFNGANLFLYLSAAVQGTW